VSLVDFGLSEGFLSGIDNIYDDLPAQDGFPSSSLSSTSGSDQPGKPPKHIMFEKINRTLGNKFFMSLTQLRKWASGRRDDLEQLMYTLAFLAKGDLPWSLKRAYATEDVLRAKATPAIVSMVFDELPL
jgi:hypothetical protein